VAPTPTPTPEPTPTPAPTAVLRFGTASLDGKFNPILVDDVYDQYVVSMIFDSLVNNDPDGSVNNKGLADHWTISDDHLTYTFFLKDAKFSNGDPVTAQDVKFTLETIGNPKYDGPLGYTIANIVGADDYTKGTNTEITGIKVIDDKIVSVTLTAPNVAELMNNIGGIGILDHTYYAFTNWDDFKALNAKPMGSGAFIFKDYDPAQACNLVVNPNYYGTIPQLAGVSILIIPDDTQIQALMTGQVDLVNPSASKDNWDAMSADSTVATPVKFVSNGYNVIGMNLQNPLFSDKKVRQALAYGLDLDSFIQTQWQGLAQRCLTPISPVSWAYPDVSQLNPYSFDPAKANELLDEAGWTQKGKDGIRVKDGKRFSFTWIAYTDTPWPKNLQALATEQWKAIGVEMKSELMDFNTVADKVFTQGKFEMFNIGWQLSIDPDPVGMYDKASDVPGGNNAIHYYNADAEALFKQEEQEFDTAKRKAELQQWALIANDDLPYIFCAVRDEIWGSSTKFSGFDKLGPYFNWTQCLSDVKAN
jgi:peptide/nickel transport system substrate-binding protein